MKQTYIEVEGSGFLTEEILDRLTEIRGINTELIRIIWESLHFAKNLVKSTQVVTPQETQSDKQRAIVLVLLVREIEIVESVLILASFGIRQDLHTLFRVFLDAYFITANVCSDPEFVVTYFQTDEKDRLKFANVAAKYSNDELFGALKKYATEEMRGELAERIKRDGIHEFNSFLFADKVGAARVYDSLYRLSSASVHTTPRCLEDYINTDEVGNILTILHQTSAETTDEVLHAIAFYLLISVRGISDLFNNSDMATLDRLDRSLQAIQAIPPTTARPSGGTGN